MTYQQRLNRAAKLLNKILADAQKEYPEAEWYVAGSSNNLHLLSGPSHDGRSGQRPRQDRVIATAQVVTIDGGDW